MTMRFATEMEMEMEMRMIKKEASKTPAYSPRVESHVVSNNLERSICLSHPAPPPASSRNTGLRRAASPSPPSQLTKARQGRT